MVHSQILAIVSKICYIQVHDNEVLLYITGRIYSQNISTIDQMTSYARKMLMLLVTFMVVGLVAFSSGEVEL